MEALGAGGLELPTWEVLIKAFPVSIWAVVLVAVGWWARGKVNGEFIKFLREMIDRRRGE